MKASWFCARLYTTLVAFMVIPTISAAFEFPAGTAPDPLGLRVCPFTYFGSRGYLCDHTTLVGSVARISYPESSNPDDIFIFDRFGRIAEIKHKIKDAIGGWGNRQFNYNPDGALDSITYNNGKNTDYQYSDGRLAKRESESGNIICDYSFSVLDEGRLSLDANCQDYKKNYQFHGELDFRGRLLKIDNPGARFMYTQGPLECAWIDQEKLLMTSCSNEYNTINIEYDERGRPILLDRFEASGVNDLRVSYSYIDDSIGNWVVQTMHYEISSGNNGKLPKDVVRRRTIEYHRDQPTFLMEQRD